MMTPDDIRISTGMRRLTVATPVGMPRPPLLDCTIWITPGAAALPRDVVTSAIVRHAHGDFGECHPEDLPMNREHYQRGRGILHSAYRIDPSLPMTAVDVGPQVVYPPDPERPLRVGDNTLWVWTEADQQTTTIMLPEEY